MTLTSYKNSKCQLNNARLNIARGRLPRKNNLAVFKCKFQNSRWPKPPKNSVAVLKDSDRFV
jgi:hypothetical protein